MTFEELTAYFIGKDVNEYTEKKGNLTYLSWAYAWREVLKEDAQADFSPRFFQQEDGTLAPFIGNDKMGYIVFTSMTINGKTRECYLPVMDNQNRSILAPKSTDINKALMRCLAKNAALFGLGLYIYAGEDLPESEKPEEKKITEAQKAEFSSLGIRVEKTIRKYGVEKLDDLTEEQAQAVIEGKKAFDAAKAGQEKNNEV